MKIDKWKKLFLQSEKVFTISRILSTAYFFCIHMPENPDNPTDVLGWKQSLRQISNDAITILDQISIEKNVI